MQVGKLKNRVIIRQVLLLLLCGAIGWYLKGKLTPQMPGLSAMGGGEPSVLVQKITASNISPQAAYIAHVEPIKSVDLKPQVAGYIEKVLFEEGSQVNEGDVLFVIEQEKYKATVSLREAELDAAKANLVKMERDYKRQVSLSKQNIASKATFDNAESNYLQAKAAVKQAEANLDLAKIDLDYTEIKAPFSGYIGKALVREGNYVSSNSTSLARIVQVNPIRVAFSMTDKDFLNIRQEYKDEKTANIRTQLVLPNGKIMQNHFMSRFNDNEINSDTATIAVYAEFNNDEGYLVPGNYVKIMIGTKDDVTALLVPQAAVAQDEHGNYVVVVDDNDIATQRRVVLGDVVGENQIVMDGLAQDEKVVIQGLQKVSDGQKVRSSLIDATEEEL